jgi:hypothetical protein
MEDEDPDIDFDCELELRDFVRSCEFIIKHKENISPSVLLLFSSWAININTVRLLTQSYDQKLKLLNYLQKFNTQRLILSRKFNRLNVCPRRKPFRDLLLQNN